MTDLGTLGGDSAASDVNNAGDVVGYSTAATGVVHAFLYRNGHMTDLNDLLPSGSDMVLNLASSINNRGQVVGNATVNGQLHAFLMSPAP